jgi:hypothetical protein
VYRGRGEDLTLNHAIVESKKCLKIPSTLLTEVNFVLFSIDLPEMSVNIYQHNGKGKAIPVQAQTGP